jgi:GT2 family glycosyltransferase
MIPTIAVLITCHNRKDITINCLSALSLQKGSNILFKIDIFLVDDGSTDGTNLLVKLKFPLVNIIQGNGKLFWNRGMHLAWETASNSKDYDYYLWLNDDTLLYEYSIIKFLNAANITNNKSVICGSTFSKINNKISYGGNSKSGNLLNPNGYLQEVFTFNGNSVLVPKFVFEKIGNLDNRFQHAIGDFDYSLRVREANLKSYILENFIGTCEGSDKLPIWCLHNDSLYKKVKNLYSPLGNSHPYYYFIFEFKHYGFFVAFKHLLTIHLRLFLPKLWIKK